MSVNEEWRPVKGYEGYYEVSSIGRVRSLDRIIEQSGKGGSVFKRFFKGCILKQQSYFGYSYVQLNKGTHKLCRVHRLVAEAFIPNPNNLPCIDHIDGNRANNNVSNLRWVTHKQNSNNPITKQRLKENAKGHICCWRGHFGKEHPNSKRVGQYSLDGILIKEFGSTMDVERELGIRHSYVSECCSGKISCTKGFIFKYLQ